MFDITLSCDDLPHPASLQGRIFIWTFHQIQTKNPMSHALIEILNKNSQCSFSNYTVGIKFIVLAEKNLWLHEQNALYVIQIHTLLVST